MSSSLLSLPNDLLILLTTHLHTIEDFVSLSSSCRALHFTLPSLTSPSTILALCNAQSRIFFRPDPHFLVLATASQLGAWARKSPQNEALFVSTCKLGLEGLLSLSLEHCGLTLERIRVLHSSRFSLVNPVENIIDQCVGKQWHSLPDFWAGGVEDANTIYSDPGETVFHLAIYGEIFKPDLDAYLNRDLSAKKLSLVTRLEFVKYCIPDWDVALNGGAENKVPSEDFDPRLLVESTGPYVTINNEIGGKHFVNNLGQGSLALAWTLMSVRWRPHWLEVRRLAGAEEFVEGFEHDWRSDAWSDDDVKTWRQSLWENVMVCQGLEGYEMLRPELRERWYERIREWRKKIEGLERQDRKVFVGQNMTFEHPDLLKDLWVMLSW